MFRLKVIGLFGEGRTMAAGRFPSAPDRLATLANWRKAPFSAWGFRNVHPDSELVIIRMASEATPLDPDRVRGWPRIQCDRRTILVKFIQPSRALGTEKICSIRGEKGSTLMS
jgi:hypothetical protein